MSSPTPTPAPPSEVDLTITFEFLDPSLGQVLDFVSSLVASLAWPVLVLVLVLMFRGWIRGVLEALAKRMGRLKRVLMPGGAEAEWFSEEVDDLAGQASELPVNDPPPSDLPSVENNTARARGEVARELSEVDSGAAIVAAFIQVEEAVRTFLESRRVTVRAGSPIGIFIGYRTLPANLRDIVRELSKLRNTAAHSRDFESPIESVLTYIDVCEEIAERIRQLAMLTDDQLSTLAETK